MISSAVSLVAFCAPYHARAPPHESPPAEARTQRRGYTAHKPSKETPHRATSHGKRGCSVKYTTLQRRTERVVEASEVAVVAVPRRLRLLEVADRLGVHLGSWGCGWGRGRVEAVSGWTSGGRESGGEGACFAAHRHIRDTSQADQRGEGCEGRRPARGVLFLVSSARSLARSLSRLLAEHDAPHLVVVLRRRRVVADAVAERLRGVLELVADEHLGKKKEGVSLVREAVCFLAVSVDRGSTVAPSGASQGAGSGTPRTEMEAEVTFSRPVSVRAPTQRAAGPSGGAHYQIAPGEPRGRSQQRGGRGA